MTISDKIQQLRKSTGLSQESFAEKLGVSRQSVSKWESGTALPDTDKIIAMSELFGVSTDYILKNEPSVPEPEQTAEVIPMKKAKKKRGKPIKIIALILAIILIITAIAIPLHYGSYREAWWELNGGKVKYPYVFVHGLGGWGEGDGINESLQYWGADATDLKAFLTKEGHEVYMPSVGPISSTWDRTCELYAQITGTRVDYGEAHSKAHNHARFGRTYDTPLVANWGEKINGGQRIKINLLGHSFGGATVRLLTSLLAYGNEAEMSSGVENVSPLFLGGKGDWVHSVTTLCAPHNGSTLTEIIDSVGGLVGVNDTTELLISLCFGIADIGSPASGTYDFKLDHFGIGELTESGIRGAVAKVTNSGDDHAGYDLSPDGAINLNKTIRTVEDVYYFSYAYSTTKEGSLLRGQVPDSSTLPILSPFALAMGSYKGTTAHGTVIDESWQENDGLVSVVSAKYPFGAPYSEFVGIPDEEYEIIRGTWHVMPTRRGDHGKVIGLGGEEKETQDFYIEHFALIDSLER